MERYGSDQPPAYDLSSIYGVPIALLCGSKDQLSSPGDFRWLRDQLGQTLCYYKEYDFGHLGFLIPPDKRIFFDILELVKRHNVEVNVSLGSTPKELLSKT